MEITTEQAKEFYLNLEEKKYFSKLTKTGISDDYDNVFEFAVNFAKEMVNKTVAEYKNNVGRCNDMKEFQEDVNRFMNHLITGEPY
jgi:hypothetical protein